MLCHKQKITPIKMVWSILIHNVLLCVRYAQPYLRSLSCQKWLSHKHIMFSSRATASFWENDVRLHFCVPCGRFFHSAKAPFHQPPQHLKQACSFISFHKSQAMLFVYWQMHPTLYFLCLKNIQKIANPSCICSIHSKHQSSFAHSIQSHPCLILLYPNIR